jgi:hypothetical protein
MLKEIIFMRLKDSIPWSWFEILIIYSCPDYIVSLNTENVSQIEIFFPGAHSFQERNS